MNKITFSFPLACLLLFNGCATNNAFMDNIGKIGGTTVGAGAGAVVGKQLGGKGGLIAGALIGGTIGYLIGDEIDKRRAELAKIAKEESPTQAKKMPYLASYHSLRISRMLLMRSLLVSLRLF